MSILNDLIQTLGYICRIELFPTNLDNSTSENVKFTCNFKATIVAPQHNDQEVCSVRGTLKQFRNGPMADISVSKKAGFQAASVSKWITEGANGKNLTSFWKNGFSKVDIVWDSKTNGYSLTGVEYSQEAKMAELGSLADDLAEQAGDEAESRNVVIPGAKKESTADEAASDA